MLRGVAAVGLRTYVRVRTCATCSRKGWMEIAILYGAQMLPLQRPLLSATSPRFSAIGCTHIYILLSAKSTADLTMAACSDANLKDWDPAVSSAAEPLSDPACAGCSSSVAVFPAG